MNNSVAAREEYTPNSEMKVTINDINKLWERMQKEVVYLSSKESNLIKAKVKILKEKESEYKNIFDSIISLLSISEVSKSTLDDIVVVTNAYIKYIDLIGEKGESISTYDDLCNLLSQIPNRFHNYIAEKLESYNRQEKISVSNNVNKRVKVNMKKIQIDSDMSITSSFFEDVIFYTKIITIKGGLYNEIRQK